jgi:1-aminocyclopropane-1-carboxylate deaminase
MMDFTEPVSIRVDSLTSYNKFHTTVDVLRLDRIDPVVSGNKWFKLKEYLKEASGLGKTTILTFGGAFSNHIVATAAACAKYGFKSIGIIRGERPVELSHTLRDAQGFGMQLHFTSREAYRRKDIPAEALAIVPENEMYLVNEGGYGNKGMEGAKDILSFCDIEQYTHIMAAVGTGTMLAGLTEAAGDQQQVIGISVMKNNFSLQHEVEQLLPPAKHQQFTILHDYHFGGYAKHTPELLQFMNSWYTDTLIPSDFVYTAKVFYALNDMVQKNYFPQGSRVLVIHSGGLQGNRSLPKGTLIF